MDYAVDDFVKTGAGHRICQDYVLSGPLPVPHVILSDGCSGSPHTDVGARLLAHAASASLDEASGPPRAADPGDLGDRIIRRASAAADALGLPPTALDATLMIALAVDGWVHVHLFGDGTVVRAAPAAAPTLFTVEYDRSAPCYLSYRRDPERLRTYREAGIGKRLNGRPMAAEAPVRLARPAEEGATVMIASDGIDSFLHQQGERVEASLLAAAFTAFKNRKGAFLERRIKRAVRDLEKRGGRHFDDLSAGAIHCVATEP